MCPSHSEAKQTEITEFGAEKVLLQGYARSQVPRRVLAKNFKKSDEEGVSGSAISACTIL